MRYVIEARKPRGTKVVGSVIMYNREAAEAHKTELEAANPEFIYTIREMEEK